MILWIAYDYHQQYIDFYYVFSISHDDMLEIIWNCGHSMCQYALNSESYLKYLADASHIHRQ